MSGKLRLTIRLVLLACLCLGLWACGEEHKEKPLRQYTLKYEEQGDTLYYSGTLQPRDIVNIPSPVEGIVVEKFYNYGQTVHQEDRLLIINSEELTKRYSSALQEYLTSKDKLATARSELKSSEELLHLGIIPKSRYVSDKSTYDNSRISYQRALYSLQKLIQDGHGQAIDLDKLDISNFAAVDKALRVKYNDLVVTAKDNGIALIPKTESGSDGDKIVVGSKVKVGEILLSIGDMAGISVDIKVNEVDIDKVKVGQTVEITGVAFPNIVLNGHIDSVDSQASSASGASGGLPNFNVKVIVPTLTEQAKKQVRVGMTVKVKLMLPKKRLLLAPIVAVRHHHGKDWVTRQRDGDVEDIEVVTGDSTANKVEIVKGLSEGDVLVYSEED